MCCWRGWPPAARDAGDAPCAHHTCSWRGPAQHSRCHGFSVCHGTSLCCCAAAAAWPSPHVPWRLLLCCCPLLPQHGPARTFHGSLLCRCPCCRRVASMLGPVFLAVVAATQTWALSATTSIAAFRCARQPCVAGCNLDCSVFNPLVSRIVKVGSRWRHFRHSLLSRGRCVRQQPPIFRRCSVHLCAAATAVGRSPAPHCLPCPPHPLLTHSPAACVPPCDWLPPSLCNSPHPCSFLVSQNIIMSGSLLDDLRTEDSSPQIEIAIAT